MSWSSPLSAARAADTQDTSLRACCHGCAESSAGNTVLDYIRTQMLTAAIIDGQRARDALRRRNEYIPACMGALRSLPLPALCLCACASYGAYPTKPIRVIVP